MKNTSKLQIEKREGNWVIGTYKGFRFNAKVYEEASVFGINEGCVSKLWMASDKGETVFNYDRGMDIDAPIGHELAIVLEAIL